MSNDELFKARHKGTRIVSRIPSSYLDIYPGVYEVLTKADLAQHRLELEEDKVVYDLEPEESPTKHAKKEGK